jgi:hypothetical protein
MKIVKLDALGRIPLKKVLDNIDEYEYFKVITKNGVILMSPIGNEQDELRLGMLEAEVEMNELEVELKAKGEL